MKTTLLAALALGAAAVLGFAPFNLFPVPVGMLALLFLLWHGAQTPRYAASIGFAWGLGFFLTGVSWIYVSLHDVGGMVLPLAALATLLFCAYLALFPALAGYAFKRLATGEAWRDGLLAAGLWTLSEYLRGRLFTGFPWLSLGYSQAGPSPLAGFAPLLGSYGIGFLLAWIAALLALGWWRRISIVMMLAVLAMGTGLKRVHWTEPVGEIVSVSLLQGNIAQSLKWDPARLDLSLSTYQRLARQHPAQLLILPETAIPLMFDEIPRGYLRALAHGREMLLGTVVQVAGPEYVNATVALDKEGVKGFYAKSHLVPFGEYVPPGFSWFFDWVRIPMTDFTAGAKRQEPLDVAGMRVASNICYEDLFGEEIIRSLPQATLLVNFSNTAWFGHSLAQPQHLQIARMRAMETGRPMLRATNTGMTAAIEPDGSVSAILPPFTEGALDTTVQGYGGATPYVRIGNIGALILALAAVLPALHRRRG